MQRPLKAALLSALVFPGVGQLYLGRRLPGALFVLGTLASVAYVVRTLATQFGPLLDEVQSGRMEPDALLILEKVHAISEQGASGANTGIMLMIALWLASTVHAWMAGSKPAP
ncbi:MAG: hypothetical protein ACJ8GW_05435 [Massilia sp.]